jgi:hypothetical protein
MSESVHFAAIMEAAKVVDLISYLGCMPIVTTGTVEMWSVPNGSPINFESKKGSDDDSELYIDSILERELDSCMDRRHLRNEDNDNDESESAVINLNAADNGMDDDDKNDNINKNSKLQTIQDSRKRNPQENMGSTILNKHACATCSKQCNSSTALIKHMAAHNIFKVHSNVYLEEMNCVHALR